MRIAIVEFDKLSELFQYECPKEMNLKISDLVVAESKHGLLLGKIIKIIEKEKGNNEDKVLPKITKKAIDKDLKIHKENILLTHKAFSICKKFINQLNISMKLIDVEYTLDKSKIIFYFVAPGRIDFRTLVKKLAATFKSRIEMRQIGVRDETRIVGGLGFCGEELCCSRFLKNFDPVSIKMAKDQNLNINIKKISGACGRLLCCLSYEQDIYTEFLKHSPAINSIIETDETSGRIVYINPIKNTVTIKNGNDVMVEIDIKKIKNVIENGGSKNGE